MDACEERLIHPDSVGRARERLDGMEFERLADTFRVLGDRTRVGILAALGAGELCVCDLAELFGLTPGAISHQLRLLKAHRLVRSRREGKLVFYNLDDEHVAHIFEEGLKHVREQQS